LQKAIPQPDLRTDLGQGYYGLGNGTSAGNDSVVETPLKASSTQN
jgi:hypothetical protein